MNGEEDDYVVTSGAVPTWASTTSSSTTTTESTVFTSSTSSTPLFIDQFNLPAIGSVTRIPPGHDFIGAGDDLPFATDPVAMWMMQNVSPHFPIFKSLYIRSLFLLNAIFLFIRIHFSHWASTLV